MNLIRKGAVLFLLLTGCAGGKSMSRGTVMPGPKATTTDAMVAALQRNQHSCQPVEKLVVCDKEVQGRPTLVPFSFQEGKSSWVGLMSLYHLKSDSTTCDQAREVFNKASSDLHFVCNDSTHLINFVAATMVPASGYSDADVEHFVEWFDKAQQGPLAIMLASQIVR